MPELPEVETIRRGLDRRLTGSRIVRIEVHETRLRRPLDVAALQGLVGRRVVSVARRGKYLSFDLGDELRWLVHLGMSGRLLLGAASLPVGAHEHVRMETDPAGTLVFRDPRRFGLMLVGPEGSFAELRLLGPEPLDSRFDGSFLYGRLRGSRQVIKAALLDQRVVAGIGNIYANEILYRAGIRPTRRCFRIGRDDFERVAEVTRQVLVEAIARRGTSFSDYFDSDGVPGSFQTRLAVFDREGEPCGRCATIVKRRFHAGRSSFYCPRCQR